MILLLLPALGIFIWIVCKYCVSPNFLGCGKRIGENGTVGLSSKGSKQDLLNSDNLIRPVISFRIML